MFKRFPLSSRFLVFLLLPLAVAGWWGVRQVRSSLPTLQGRVDVVDLRAPADVRRDKDGVPIIVARTDHDAFFALGYAHAQDRMWQLELQRRIAYGRLSEVFGKQSVEQDIWFRTLGLERSAHDAWNALSPEAQDSLQAYADGINAWLQRDPSLPPEFALLQIKPQPWTVYDSLSWIKVFALNLGGNYRQEIERMLARQILEPHKYAALYPAGTAAGEDLGKVAAPAPLLHFLRFQDDLQRRLGLGGRYVGSNAWVVSGRLTADGNPMLANDPHLGLQMPSLWYMAQIKGDRIDARGATLVGLPLVIFGRNQHIAWGGTNFMADAQDLYLEQVDPDDTGRYLTEHGWERFDTSVESIQVRQDFPAFLRSPLRPLRIHVRRTRHGPVVSDLFKVFDQPVALRWTALDKDDTSYESFYKLNYAHDWASFRDAAGALVAPALNLLYIDRDGNIGHVAAGRVPVRRSGRGDLPAPGWNTTREWIGYLSPEQLPSRYNPTDGYLVSANERFFGDDYPYYIGDDWAQPDRARRIEQRLKALIAHGTPVTAEAMGSIQNDTVSEPARRLLARLLRHQPSNQQQRDAFVFLRGWNGDMARSSQAASIFNAWVRTLRRELMADELRTDFNQETEGRYVKSIADNLDLDALGRLLVDGPHSWCGDTDMPAQRCDDVIDASLNDALWDLRKMAGDTDMHGWKWGDLHATVYRHTPFSGINVVRSVFERRIGNGGSPDTVNVASYSYDKSGRFIQDFGPGFRQVIGMGKAPDVHLYMNSTGQSGNVASTHYDDMVERFRDGQLSRWPQSGQMTTQLQLVPANATAGVVSR